MGRGLMLGLEKSITSVSMLSDWHILRRVAAVAETRNFANGLVLFLRPKTGAMKRSPGPIVVAWGRRRGGSH